jgi:hypothetical protein
MRSDWVPLSASALVVGVMSLVFGSLLNPADAGSTTADTLRVVSEDSARWLAMAVMFAFASVALTLGMPSVMTLFDRRARKLGLTAVVLFTIGSIGTCGYAMLMVFFRAMVVNGAIRGSALEEVTSDRGLAIFLEGWIGSFYGGVLLLAIALLVARSTHRWVPLVLVVFVAMLPAAPHLGRVGAALQVLLLAVAFTGIAMAAVSAIASSSRQPAF